MTHEEIAAHQLVRERFTALADASAIVGSHATRAQGTHRRQRDERVAGDGGRRAAHLPRRERDAASPRGSARSQSASSSRARAGRSRDRTSCWRGGRPRAGGREPAVATSGSSTAARWRSPSSARRPRVTLDGGTVAEARVAITALAPTIRRVPEAEAALTGSRRRPGGGARRPRRRRQRRARSPTSAASAATAARWPR